MLEFDPREGSSYRHIMSSDAQFSMEEMQRQFETRVFRIIDAQFLNALFFRNYDGDVQIINYHLDRIIYCTYIMNLDSCAGFYNNLRQISEAYIFRTRVAQQDIEFTP